MASGGTGHEDAADRSVTCAPADSFVINLCSSTTPMALTQPDAPELKRFRFFVSRRLEDRRERFRLHMGYFASLEEAEEWLSVVRDVYPGAWAGEAPGKRLRARAAAALPASPSLPLEAAAVAVAAPAASPWEAPSASIIALSSDIAVAILVLPPAPAALSSAPSETVAVSIAAPAATAAPPATPASAIVTPEVVAAIMRPADSPPAASVIAAPENGGAPATAPITPPSARAKEQPKDAVIAVTAPSAAAPRVPLVKKSKEAAASVAASSTRAAPMAPLSNVREVLASLDERDAKDAAPAPSAAERTPTLSDTQVMKILEERRSRQRARGETPDASSDVPMQRPDDTGTRRALKEAVQDNAAVSFAVQLQWSVQPMALDKVPPLAIFSAYTLYTVDGNREGRKWYGLRLGFFSDAEAAKQVAHYVRSEFTAVAVVPVSPQERGRATEADQKTQIACFRETSRKTQAEEIKLLDEENAYLLPRAPAEPMRGAAKLAAGGAHTVSPAARAAARSKKLRSKARAAERKAPCSLEETLEILGAGALEIDNGRGEFINESRVRHLKVEVRKNSPFARLVARLTERVRKT
jgi:hypothetical protein